MKKIFIYSLLLASLFTTSCKKDDPKPSDPTENATLLLQNKNWKITSITLSPAYMGVTNVLDMWDACDQDDLYRFNPSSQFVLNSGSLLCYPDEDQEQYGTWSYTESSKMLTFQLQQTGDFYDIKLTSITDTRMTGTQTENFEGVDYRLTWVFEKQ